MSRHGQIIILGFVVLLSSCVSSDQVYVYEGRNVTPAANEASVPNAVEIERQRIAEAREKQRQEETEARVEREAEDAIEATEVVDTAEVAEQARIAETARIAQERVTQEEAAAARRAQAEQQAQAEQVRQAQAEQQAQAQELARQEVRVAELKAQIESSIEDTEGLEAANVSLQDAVSAAEDLSTALSTEQQKYSQIDPDTGETLQALDKEALEQLSEQVEQLKAQAESLASATN